MVAFLSPFISLPITLLLLLLITGVIIGPSGNKTIRFRPALIFQREHAEVFLSIFESVLKEY